MTEENDSMFLPRNDFCLLRFVDLGKAGKLIMPSQAAQGKEWRVAAVGPKVTDLKKGDRVQPAAVTDDKNPIIFQLPSHKDLMLIREQYLAMVYGEVEEADG